MGVKISELDSVEELQNADVFPVVQNGETKKVSKTQLLGQIENQIATNMQDISNIKEEQQTQNTDIAKNKDDIENLNTTKANRTEIPTDLSQLSNTTTKFVNETQLANVVQEETTARQNADVNLQGQIDAIVAQSDVVDVVGTYADLLGYDTSKITENDIVKVLNDNTHDNTTSYFRWKNNSWNYVGSEGPFYTKSETDSRLNLKANQTSLDTTNQNLNTLSGRVGTNEGDISDIKAEQTTQNNQIATLMVDSGHTIELSINSQTYVLTATLKNKGGDILGTSNVDLPLEAMIVNATYDSNTKELVLTLQNGNTIRVSIADIVSGLVSQTDFNALELRVVAVEGDIVDIKAEQLTQNAEIDELQTEVENLQETVNSELEDGTATGTSITVNDSAIADGSIEISGRTEQETNIMTYHCNGTETGDYYFTYNNVNYQFTMPTITEGSILAFNTDTLKLYLGETEITTTTDNTGTLITLQDTPNPEYPQTIHKVKGANVIKVSNSDNTESQMLPFTLAEGQEMYEGDYLASDGIHNLRGKIVLDGTETWGKGTSTPVFYRTLPRNTYSKDPTHINISNYFKGIPFKTGLSGIAKGEYAFYKGAPTTINIYELYINYDENATIEQFKQFLAEKYSNGNPVELVFDINEKTTPYNETQQAQYNALQKIRTYYGETNIETITAEDLKPMLTLNYEKSIATLIADSGHTIELSINSQNYVLTATLKNKGGEILNTSNVDLPLEAMIINATYDSNTKELVLTLQNGNTIRVSIADIISGLVNQTDFNALELRVQTAEGDISDIKLEQLTQNANIVELQEQVEILENTVNSELEDATATGEEISVTDSANAPAKLLPGGRTEQNQYEGYNELETTMQYNRVTVSGITVTTNSDGTITLNGTASSATEFKFMLTEDVITLLENENYMLTRKLISGTASEILIAYRLDGTTSTFTSESKNLGTSTSSRTIDNVRIYINSGVTFNNARIGISLYKSSTEKPYEPYVGGQVSPSPKYEQPIHNVSGHNEFKISNADDTEYQTEEFTLVEGQKMFEGDYLADDGIHHITGEIVFKGTEEGWEENGSGTNTYRFMRGVPTLQNAQNGFCNSNKFVTSGVSSDVELAGIVGGNLYYRIKKSTIDSLEGNTNVNKFKNWLSNNPMTIQTKLKTETIESYNETQQAQYNALQKILTYFGQTNVDTVIVGDLKPMLALDYKKSSNLRIKALEEQNTTILSRLDLLES